MGHQVWEGHAMMALNLDTFTLFIVLTLTYGLHLQNVFLIINITLFFFREIDMREI